MTSILPPFSQSRISTYGTIKDVKNREYINQ
jgi:hypothetical protein